MLRFYVPSSDCPDNGDHSTCALVHTATYNLFRRKRQWKDFILRLKSAYNYKHLALKIVQLFESKFPCFVK